MPKCSEGIRTEEEYTAEMCSILILFTSHHGSQIKFGNSLIKIFTSNEFLMFADSAP